MYTSNIFEKKKKSATYPAYFTRIILKKKVVLLRATQGGLVGAIRGPLLSLLIFRDTRYSSDKINWAGADALSIVAKYLQGQWGLAENAKNI